MKGINPGKKNKIPSFYASYRNYIINMKYVVSFSSLIKLKYANKLAHIWQIAGILSLKINIFYIWKECSNVGINLLCVCLTSEGITAWSYFEQVFERKGSRKVEIWMFILGYSLLFALSQFKNVLINTVAFLFVNLILLFSNFACKKLIGIIQVAFLTVVMGGTEILAAVLLLPISHDFEHISMIYLS